MQSNSAAQWDHAFDLDDSSPVELIAPHYSWDVRISTSTPSSSSSRSSPWLAEQMAKSGQAGDVDEYVESSVERSNIGTGSDSRHPMHGIVERQDEWMATRVIESLLSRVRSVGEAETAPNIVHQSTKRLQKRKSLAPAWPLDDLSPRMLARSAETGRSVDVLSKRGYDTVMARSPAPASVAKATQLLYRRSVVGPHAHIHVSDMVDGTLSIGTAALRGTTDMTPTLSEPFSVFLPPPFRILFLISLGLLCWSANLRGLRRLGLDADGMLSSETKVRVLPHHRSRGEQLLSSTGNSAVPVVSGAMSSRNLIGHVDTEIALFFRHPGHQESASFYLGLAFLIWTIFCWILYRLWAFSTIFYGGDLARGMSEARGRHAQAIQGIAVLGVVAVACWPGDVMYRPMRRAMGKHVVAICTPSFKQRIYFPDVVLADILTSFARVFGELWLTMCFLWPKSDTPAWWNGKGSIAVPFLVSLPYMIRFRQCLSEYNVSTPSAVDGRRHLKPLYNAAKYASAFPVIWLSVLQGKRVPGEQSVVDADLWYCLWIGSVLVNSLFSFWWDVSHDWGLEMLKWSTWSSTPSLLLNGVRSIHRRNTSTMPSYMSMRESSAPKTTAASFTNGGSSGGVSTSDTIHGRPHNMLGNGANSLDGGSSLYVASSTATLTPVSHVRKESHFLRSPDYVMLFPPIVYQLAVTTDLVLRFAWSLKLSSHLHHIIELESTAFYLEALEILRRWMWTYLRIEWEACKRRSWETEGSMESLTLSTLRQDSRTARGSDPSTHRD